MGTQKALLTLLLFATQLFAQVTAQTCDAEGSTLSSSCGGVCDSHQPCLTYNVSESTSCNSCVADAAGDCNYVCYNIYRQEPVDQSLFVFFVTYGTYQSEEEIEARAQDSTYDINLESIPDNTSTYAWASNNIITRIGALDLPSATKQVVLAGGTSFDLVFKSKVVNLQLAEDLLTSQKQVTQVWLLSINLKGQIGTVRDLLPFSITYLNLANTLLYEFPADLLSLPSISLLDLNLNYITAVNSSIRSSKLTNLGMSLNGMESFEGDFPNLAVLTLTENNFTEIPAVIFTMTSLTSLYLAGNPLKTPTLTLDQVNFLAGLTDLDLTAADFHEEISCDTSAQRTIQGLTVCVSDLMMDSNQAGSGSNNGGSGSTSNSNTMIIVVIAVGGIILLAVIGVIVYCLKMRTGDKPDTMAMTNPTLRITRDNYDNLSIWRDPELLSLQVSVQDIQDIRLIGSGAFGVVWLVRYRRAQLFASKRLREDMATHERVQNFVDEIKMVSKFDHPSIVKFIGAAWSIESDLQALFEYMENGDLRTYLSASNLPRYWTSTQFQLAIDTIEALVYVHSFDPPLIHRDLKSRNVLISVEMHAKLTDFGTTRYRSKDNTMTIGVGTGRWLAPEIISGSTEYDQSADIFSFGVLLTEIDTHNLPYYDAVGPRGNKLEEVAILQKVANDQLRPTIGASCPPTVRDLANRCMSQSPLDRPLAAEVAYVLRTVQKEMNSF
ncbi:TKL protein kinase [Phytophthora nicotianae CJ01A1]|uniref:TKL protein kinase n=3 Tax=Phytophthora nicotianae TaxID=4792 RepID=W2P260_PHYNI|nr:TKL protein kinase [Phytophthora nicotianae]ETL46586.1 TKL protein kinase [Phytophthora nicotianae]ETM54760.1 TKL protein kinase [Phytophthora nicotianae]ETO83991.1 TKL protein kinase [Phytophthora nicotianae P1976]ETP25061.1 TKL protein kinase [Phytophthora nicotianae CJ01A1]